MIIREFIAINKDGRSTCGDCRYFIADNKLCYTTGRYPDEIKESAYTLKELVELINSKGHREKFEIVNEVLIAKYLMMGELLR